MIYKDLREYIAEVERADVLRHVHGAHPNLEIGGITEVAAGLPECPALLFDRIAGYPVGFRVFTNPINTPQRAAIALGIDPGGEFQDRLAVAPRAARVVARQIDVQVVVVERVRAGA